jgi:small subunit ribosomal protein S6e
MAKFKIIVSDPMTGKSNASEIEGSRAQALIGRSLGELIDGSALGIGQGKFLISGGCDKNGIPMRADVHGAVKKHIVLSSGPGFRSTRHGERRRKLVRGKIISDETYQINFTSKKEAESTRQAPAEVKPAEMRTPKELPQPPKEKAAHKPLPKKTVKKSVKKGR